MTEREVVAVEGWVARCRGTADCDHPEIELPLRAGTMSTCPVCGRAYRRDGGQRIGPAVWPKEE